MFKILIKHGKIAFTVTNPTQNNPAVIGKALTRFHAPHNECQIWGDCPFKTKRIPLYRKNLTRTGIPSCRQEDNIFPLPLAQKGGPWQLTIKNRQREKDLLEITKVAGLLGSSANR